MEFKTFIIILFSLDDENFSTDPFSKFISELSILNSSLLSENVSLMEKLTTCKNDDRIALHIQIVFKQICFDITKFVIDKFPADRKNTGPLLLIRDKLNIKISAASTLNNTPESEEQFSIKLF